MSWLCYQRMILSLPQSQLDPPPFVNDDQVGDAPHAPQSPELPVPLVGVDGLIGDTVDLHARSSRASPPVTRAQAAKQAQGPVTEQQVLCELRDQPVDRLNYLVPGGIFGLFAGNNVPKASFCVGLAETV